MNTNVNLHSINSAELTIATATHSSHNTTTHQDRLCMVAAVAVAMDHSTIAIVAANLGRNTATAAIDFVDHTAVAAT